MFSSDVFVQADIAALVFGDGLDSGSSADSNQVATFDEDAFFSSKPEGEKADTPSTEEKRKAVSAIIRRNANIIAIEDPETSDDHDADEFDLPPPPLSSDSDAGSDDDEVDLVAPKTPPNEATTRAEKPRAGSADVMPSDDDNDDEDDHLNGQGELQVPGTLDPSAIIDDLVVRIDANDVRTPCAEETLFNVFDL